MDDQKNVIAAMVLSAIVLFGYVFFVGKPASDRAQEQAALQAEQAAVVQTEPEIVPLQSRDTLVNSGARIKIETPSLSGSFLVTGSRFDDLQLKNYKATLDADSGPVITLTPEGADHSAYVFDNWTLNGAGSGVDTPWQVISGDRLTPTTPITLGLQTADYRIERVISVDERYLITLDDTITNISQKELTLQRKGAARQHSLPDDLTNFFILQEGPISVVDNKLVDMKYKKLKDKGVNAESGESGWAGLTDKYWLIAAVAPQGKTMTSKFAFRTINDIDVYEAGYELAPLTLTPGATVNSKGFVYAGAKDRNVLESYMDEHNISRLDLAIDWGFLGILTRPMSWALSFLGSTLGNFGLGIMALTLLIKIVLFPLFNKQYESQAKMKKVQPKLKKIQTLYKDDRMKLQQEMMALYKKEGVNPMAGCLPIIPTIFVFFALYKSVFINVDLRHAPFFGWIQDLSAKDPLSILNGFGLLPWDPVPFGIGFLAIGPLAILYGITMALMYTLTPQQTGGNSEMAEMQQKIFKYMPWIFMFILAPFATGLLVYWVWNNVLSFIQQYYITRKFKVDTPVDAFFRRLLGKPDPQPE